jgi:hypothetical protein
MPRKHRKKVTQLTKTTRDFKNCKIKKFIQVFHQFSHQTITQQSNITREMTEENGQYEKEKENLKK